jgi:hypothetical protein
MTTETKKAWREHWQAFAQPLQGDSLVSRFVTNPNVTELMRKRGFARLPEICFPIGFASLLVQSLDRRTGIEVYELFRSAI